MKLSGRFNLIIRKWYESAADEDECWIWRFSTNGVYPTARLNNRNVYAHRLVWSLVNGQRIPPKMEVCHSCDTPLCVNPKHLWLGTRTDNQRDCSRKGRVVNRLTDALRSQTHCKRGHEFTPENIYPHSGRRGCRQCRREWYHRRAVRGLARQVTSESTPDPH